jgi:hypothetical protein
VVEKLRRVRRDAMVIGYLFIFGDNVWATLTLIIHVKYVHVGGEIVQEKLLIEMRCNIGWGMRKHEEAPENTC